MIEESKIEDMVRYSQAFPESLLDINDQSGIERLLSFDERAALYAIVLMNGKNEMYKTTKRQRARTIRQKEGPFLSLKQRVPTIARLKKYLEERDVFVENFMNKSNQTLKKRLLTLLYEYHCVCRFAGIEDQADLGLDDQQSSASRQRKTETLLQYCNDKGIQLKAGRKNYLERLIHYIYKAT